MSASLEFSYVYTGEVSQTTTLTVTGESQTKQVTADEVVVVNVTPSELNALMTVGPQSASGVGYPAVTLDWMAVKGKVDPKWKSFMDISTPDPVTFSDDLPVECKTLQKVFASESFVFSGDSPLLKIPPEAISRVDTTGAFAITAGGNAVSKEKMAGTSTESGDGNNTILGGSIQAPSGDLSTDGPLAVRSLFLQSLAAGRYKQSDAVAPDGKDIPANASAGFDFVAGDTLSVYTRLALKKSRSFIPDPVDALPGPAGMRFKVDGSDVIVDAVDDTVDSDVKQWTVEWKLTVASGSL